MSVTVEWHGRIAVVVASGEIDMVTAPQLEEAMTTALGKQPEVLIADLTAVTFISSAGLAALVGAHRRAGAQIGMRVVATNRATVRPLQVTGLDEVITVCGSREEALTAE